MQLPLSDKNGCSVLGSRQFTDQSSNWDLWSTYWF